MQPTFLEIMQRVATQIIDDMIKGQQIKSMQSVIHGNPQGSVVRLWSTLYSPWGIHPKNVTYT